MPFSLSIEQAAVFSTILLRGIQTEFPNKLDHVMYTPEDVQSPKALHPAFYGCFDWHSAVHSHWALVRLLNQDGVPDSHKTVEVLAAHLTKENLEAERAYFLQPERGGFERPYGWAWLLTLAAELDQSDLAELRPLSENLRSFEAAVVGRFLSFLPELSRPNRGGLHGNTAFALGLVYDYAGHSGHSALLKLVEEKAILFYCDDADGPIQTELGPADFLSPCLVEADLMRRVLAPSDFAPWFNRFLPSFDPNQLLPVQVGNRADLQLVHLDGLNLSRAWCLEKLSHPIRSEALRRSAAIHAAASLPYVASGHYGGEHWLPSFAVYLLTGR